MDRLKIGLNCIYQCGDLTFEVKVKKVGKKAVLLGIFDVALGYEEKYWFPFKFISLKKGEEGYYLLLDAEQYCKFFKSAKNPRYLINCTLLETYFGCENFKPLKWEPKEIRLEEIEPALINLLGITEKDLKTEPPEWIKELEMLKQKLAD